MTDIQTWATPEWRAEIEGWIAERLAERGSRVTGAIEQPHLRPWSTVLRVPASDGLVYCKACMTGLEDETRLTAALADWRPDLMPEVLAIDGRRGWMLTQDAGPMLRTITRSEPPNLAPWLEILPRYAELQIELAPRAGELLALGAPDHRPALLADLLTLMLDDDESIRIGPPDGLSDDEVQHLHALVPRVAALSAELAGYGIADSLDHGDFHDGNVFIGGGRLTLADWGDCRVTHPFFTLGITLRGAAHFAGIADDVPPILAMRDAYLEPWEAVAPRADLVRAFALAYQLSHISSARNWHRLVVRLTGEQRAQEADAVPYKLRQFLLAAGQL